MHTCSLLGQLLRVCTYVRTHACLGTYHACMHACMHACRRPDAAALLTAALRGLVLLVRGIAVPVAAAMKSCLRKRRSPRSRAARGYKARERWQRTFSGSVYSAHRWVPTSILKHHAMHTLGGMETSREMPAMRTHTLGQARTTANPPLATSGLISRHSSCKADPRGVESSQESIVRPEMRTHAPERIRGRRVRPLTCRRIAFLELVSKLHGCKADPSSYGKLPGKHRKARNENASSGAGAYDC